MAFKLRPLYKDKLHFVGLSDMQILILALEASQKLEWNIEEVTLQGIVLNVPITLESHGEEITLDIARGSDGEISVRSQSLSIQFVDFGKNRKNIRKLKEAMEDIRSALSPEELARKANILEEELTRPLTEEEKAYIEEQEKNSSFISFFIPRKGYLATPLLIDFNILVFILMALFGAGILNPSSLTLLKWGADFGPLTLTGDWWRTVTCNFIHIGIFHLLMNMYAFMYIGFWLEDLIGPRRMLVSYLLTGVCSATFSLYIHPEIVSAGASGSIFGLYGIFLAYLLFHCIPRAQRKALLTSILIFVGYNLLYGLRAGIDNAAHIGGLLGGFLLGLIYVAGDRFEKNRTRRYIAVSGELVIAGIFLISFLALSRNSSSMYEQLRREWESGAVEAYLKGQQKENNAKPAKSATPQFPSYIPVGNNDTWLSFFDAVSGLSCQYPTNWTKISKTQSATSTAQPPLLWLVNGGNQFKVTTNDFDTREEFERTKKLLLTLPRDEKGNPSELYKQSNVVINGLSMTKTANPLHIGVPDEPGGDDIEQIVLKYFQEDKLRIFVIVMHVRDEEARADLEAISSSIQITK